MALEADSGLGNAAGFTACGQGCPHYTKTGGISGRN